MLPPDAVVMTGGDHFHFGFLYARIARGQRPDVLAMTYELLALPWYQERLARQLGSPTLVPAGAGAPSVRLAENVLARGRPLFVDGEQRNILAALPSYPYGPLFRILPRGTAQPPLDEILALNKRVLEQFDLRYRHPAAGDGWAALVHHFYARWWRSLAVGLRGAGRTADADAALDLAGALAPH
jgi:hypothetical protein